MSRYTNGSALTRGEFIAHMERTDASIAALDERLDRIEAKLDEPRKAALRVLGATVTRAMLVISGVLLTYIAAHFGFGFA